MLKRLAKSAYDAAPFKPMMMRALRGVWQPPERVYRHLHFKAPIGLDLPNGARMRIHHFGNQVENDLFWSGFGNGWERASLIAWLWLVKDANVVMDIGANTGVYALSAQATRPQAEIYAFEPVARIHAKLARNVALNGYPITALNIALSDDNGSVSLYDPGGEHAYSASLNAEMIGAGTNASTIEARRLDDLARERNIGKIDVMKIDVEMHEPEVIAGAMQRIAGDRPAMLIEILNKAIGARIAEQLSDYAFFEIGERIERTDSPGANADRNYLVLPLDDPRVMALGAGVDIETLRGWVR